MNTDTMIPNDRSATSRVASPQARLKRRRIVAALAAVWIPIGLARSAPIEAAAQTAPRSTPRDGDPMLLVGTGQGGGSGRTISAVDGSEVSSGDPFDFGFGGGVRVAAGDVNGDGVADLIVGSGPGRSQVRVYNGQDLALLMVFTPSGVPSSSGVYVAAGDVDGDGRADIIVGAGAGGLVVAISGANGREIGRVRPFGDAYTGGVTVAVGDFDGDRRGDLVAGMTAGGVVAVLSGADGRLLTSGEPYGAEFRGGVNVATGDLNGDGIIDIITAPRSGGDLVLAYSGADLSVIASLVPYPGIDGVTVAAADIDGDGRTDIIAGSGSGAPRVRIFSGSDLRDLGSLLAFDGASGSGVFVAANARLRVHGAPVFTSGSAASWTVDTAASFSIAARGFPAAAITLDGTLPDGLSFTGGIGSAFITGSPRSAGSTAVTVTAANSVGTATQTLFLSVRAAASVGGTASPTTAPVFVSTNAATIVVGTAVTFTVTAAGAASISLGGALPAGVVFTDSGTGTAAVAGTARAGTAGTYPLTFTATNAVGAATQTFTLTVNNPAPLITSAAAATFPIGAAGHFTVTTSALPAVNLITEGQALPAGVAFVDNRNGTATLSGTPNPGTMGIYPLTITASNGTGTATQNFTLTITAPAGSAPTITSANTDTFAIGTADTFTITTTGAPAPASITSSGALPPGVLLTNNGDGTATLAGTAGAGSAGMYPLTLSASNGVAAATQAFTLTIDDVTTIPDFTSPTSGVFSVGIVGTFAITTASAASVTAITLTGILPAGVNFSDNGDGTATLFGTPDVGSRGEYALTFTATNSAGATTESFTLIVQRSPLFTSGSNVTFTAGAAASFSITAAGLPSPALTRTGVLPAGITFTDNDDGTATVQGTAAAGRGGSFPLTITAVNGVGAPVTLSVTLTVNDAGVFTSTSAATFAVGAAGGFSIATSSFPAVTAIVRVGALPTRVFFTDNGDGTATLSGTPDVDTGGAYPLTFTFNNGVGGDVVQTFTLTVQEPPLITSIGAAAFTSGVVSAFSITATGFPAPTAAVTAGTLPAGITLDSVTRVLGGQATQAGVFPIGITVSNGVAPDATQAFTLTISCSTITITGTALHDGLFQTAYVPVAFTATGSTGSSMSWSATGLPAGVTINPATGVVSGIPINTALNAAVTISASDNVGCAAAPFSTTLTVRPTTVDKVYNGAVGNTQLVVGAAGPATPNVLINDTVVNGGNGPAPLSVAFPANSANGVIVPGATAGTFTYAPSIGFAGPSDAFTYTLTDGNGVTNTGRVTINLSNVVWYVNSVNPISGDGRSQSPFNSLTSAGLASSSGQYIYVHTGGATTPGDLTLDPDQTLQGAGGVFSLGGLIIPAGTRPTLTGTVTLANNTAVKDVNFAGAGPAIAASSTSMTLPSLVDQVTVTGGTSALSLTDVTAAGGGAITVSNAILLNATGADVLISGGNVPVSFAPTTNIVSATARSVDIRNRTGGSVTFGGPINDAGTGIFLDGNSGSIAFTGALTLSTGVSTAFTATNGGIVTTSGAGSVITTTAAPGLVVSAVGGNQTWQAITATNSSTGISVRNLTGSFTVTGVDGADADTDADATTGGTISNMTQRGAEFVSVSGAVSLNGMNFRNAGTTNGTTAAACGNPQTGTPELCNAAIHLQSTPGGVSLVTIDADGGAQIGINGIDVANLVMRTVHVANFGDEPNEHGVQLKNLTGTGSLTGGMFHDNEGRELYISNGSGTLTSFVIASSTFDGNDPGRNGMDGIQVETFNPGTVATVAVTTSTISDNGGSGFEALADLGSQLTATITNSTLTNNNNAIVVQAAGESGVTTTITGNQTLTGRKSRSHAMLLQTNGNSTLTGTIQSNTIGNDQVGSGADCNGACDGIAVNAIEGGVTSMDIRGNTVQHVDGDGMQLAAGVKSAGGLWPRADFTVSGNLIRDPDGSSPDRAFYLFSGTVGDIEPGTCLWTSLGGSVAWPGSPSIADGVQNRIEGEWEPAKRESGREILLRRNSGGNIFRVLGLPADLASADAFVEANNSITSVTGNNVSLDNFSAPNFTAGTTCRF